MLCHNAALRGGPIETLDWRALIMVLVLTIAMLVGLALIGGAQREAARRHAMRPALVPVRRIQQPGRYRGRPLG